ncbi:MAG TPA: hypothetical protein PK736_03155 [Bacteroidia bacterium]|nr:hypothetical protein [Bacteroidia bacterium]
MRSKYISITTDTIAIDTLSIIPASLKVKTLDGKYVDDSLFIVDNVTAKLVWNKTYLPLIKSLSDSMWISYRVLAVNLNKAYYNKTNNPQNLDKYGFSQYAYSPRLDVAEDFFSTGGVSKIGSIARGISFGNNQDVVLNSSLNLQLAGKLNNNWEIAAAITDNNIPIQPEGNVQQLQDFDRVFIQLKSKDTKITAGDFDVVRPVSYFLSLQKRGQGLLVNHNHILSKKDSTINSTTAGAAISRGKFARNVIPGVEGSQGPYRLTGAQNELFIIVLAGTERIFIDGRLMVRGTQGDYTIDYNTAEVVFTARQLITRDVRIIAEFQYSDKNYLRTMLYVNNEFHRKKLNVRVNFFNEQDSKNQPLLQTLDDSAKAILTLAGNNPALAVIPQIDSVAFNTNEILYAKIDTIVNTILYKNILRYSTNPDSAYYRVVFSQVGNSKGNYVQSITAANGRVYNWVAPVNGIPQGNYEPVTQLIAPKREQQLTAAADYQLGKYSNIVWEGSITNNDANLFSPINNKNNVAGASLLTYNIALPLDTHKTKPLKLFAKADWEFVQKKFTPIAFYRNPEFIRDWNIINNSVAVDENIIAAAIGLHKDESRFLKYTLRSFLRDSLYSGYMNIVNGAYMFHNFKINTVANYLTTRTQNESSRFLRSLSELSKQFKPIVTGVRFEQEENIMKAIRTDSLYPVTNRFQWVTVFMNNAKENTAIDFNVQASKRWDDKVLSNILAPFSSADQAKIIASYKNKVHRIILNSQYRSLKYKLDSLTNNNETTVLNRIDYSVNINKGGINLNTSYETGNGRELRKEYVFLETTPGQGVYTWIDYNKNGVKELNEFEVAQFTDQANYIKVLLPTNTYIKAFTNSFTGILAINASQLIKSENKFSKWCKKFSNQFALKIDNKITSNKNGRGYNPFYSAIADTSLIITNNSLRNNLSYNKSSSVWDADYLYTKTQAKNLLNSGYEFRTKEIHAINTRVNFSSQFTLVVKGESISDNNKSEFFTSRNFSLASQQITSTFSYQYLSTFNASLIYLFGNKTNASELKERAQQNNIGIECRLSGIKKGNLNTQFHFINLKYNGAENTPVAYEMLEGLRTGINTTWNVNYQQNISKSLQITIGYEGRKSPTVKTVHVGNMTARAFF